MAHPTEHPPTFVGALVSFSKLRPLQSSFASRPACLASRPQALPYRGFSSLAFAGPTHSGPCSGSLLSRGLSPPCSALPTRRRALPPCRCFGHHSPSFPGCRRAKGRLRGLLPLRRCGVPLWFYPRKSSLPSSGFASPRTQPPPCSAYPKAGTPSAHGVLSRILGRIETRPCLRPLASSVLRGRWFSSLSPRLPPHSRFRAADPLKLGCVRVWNSQVGSRVATGGSCCP